MAELERCRAFLRELDRRAAGRTLTYPFGEAHLHERLPRVWSRNYLVAENNLEAASPRLLASEADRILGGAGLRHRRVEIPDDETGARLEAGFRALGWGAECDLVMVAAGHEPDRRPDLEHTEEVGFQELESIWAEGIRSEPFGQDEEVVRQLIENKRVVTGAIDTRFFAARVDGAIASYCDLYSDGRTGQIEAVMTLERYRNQGLARATVLRALAASREAGNDVTFLLAMRDDWPHELYRKLGFDVVGRMWSFLRAPPAS
jgi:ribosomal protein S18 acetylase RimI-like enzyme